jgi:sortase A
MTLGKRKIFGALTIVFGLSWLVLIVFDISGNQTSPARNAAQVRQLPEFESSPAPSNSTSANNGSEIIGTITIPSAQVLALPITRGVDKATLNTGIAGAYPWSGPGLNGVFALAAHRVGAGGPFRHLDQVNIGDRLSVEANSKTFTYRVTSNIIVEPEDTFVLNGPKDDSRIVLITCTPLNTFKQRIVVTAELIPEAK